MLLETKILPLAPSAPNQCPPPADEAALCTSDKGTPSSKSRHGSGGQCLLGGTPEHAAALLLAWGSRCSRNGQLIIECMKEQEIATLSFQRGGPCSRKGRATRELDQKRVSPSPSAPMRAPEKHTPQRPLEVTLTTVHLQRNRMQFHYSQETGTSGNRLIQENKSKKDCVIYNLSEVTGPKQYQYWYWYFTSKVLPKNIIFQMHSSFFRNT